VTSSVDVVIPVFGQYGLTRACLEHLSRQTVSHQVIVVDDGSSDGTSDVLKLEWPAAKVIRLDSNVGYTRAVNRGVLAGSADYIVLLNNDVELRADCLERLIAPMESDQRIGSVAALMLMPDNITIDSFGITVDCTLAGFARLRGQHRSDALVNRPVLAGPEGTAGAYRRTAWEQAGGLDETIVAYMEVVDLALRLRTAGWKSAAAMDAAGIHLGSSTYGRRSSAQRRLAGFSRGYLLRRYGVLRRRAAARALVTELLVVVADLLLCRDLAALLGRLQGWRAGRRRSRYPWPPEDSIDRMISLRRSLELRTRTVRSVSRR
jgi:N-acetylglucosaminyl-diphospho-decaprenol L-rhamnosyltransferase